MKEASVRIFCIGLLFILQSSCSLPQYRYQLPLSSPNPEESALKRINIRSFWSNRFTGLLAISHTNTNFHYVLLDATGITLLEAKISNPEQYQLVHAVKKIAESSLPDILAKSLERIYLIEPTRKGCSHSLLAALCQKRLDDGTRIKYCRNGPFTGWRVTVDRSGKVITYSQPWVGFTLTLTDIGK